MTLNPEIEGEQPNNVITNLVDKYFKSETTESAPAARLALDDKLTESEMYDEVFSRMNECKQNHRNPKLDETLLSLSIARLAQVSETIRTRAQTIPHYDLCKEKAARLITTASQVTTQDKDGNQLEPDRRHTYALHSLREYIVSK